MSIIGSNIISDNMSDNTSSNNISSNNISNNICFDPTYTNTNINNRYHMNFRHYYETLLKTWIMPKKIYHDIKNNNYEVTILWFTMILTLIIIVYVALVGIDDPIETLRSI